MNINKKTVMITKSKFQNIKEELNHNYYKNYNPLKLQTGDYDGRLIALKRAVDDLLTLLDKAVY